ncbi:MAG: bifunctional phosphoribosylaminoimidazolecarboxamide formyltransferase/IMP cyclohydrolase [Bacteroidales bacterium]
METHIDKKLSRALISVYDKEPVRELVQALHAQNIEIISTGGTMQFIRDELDIPVTPVEELTTYPSILGGRVKTLHPAVFGGILSRPGTQADDEALSEFHIQAIDMVVVDLYPFEKTLLSGAGHDELIEKIDIGGISLIRAAAKNFRHVLVVPSSAYFDEVRELVSANEGVISPAVRRKMAAAAFNVSSHYDTMIFGYMNNGELDVFKESIPEAHPLRYGENPHQQGCFYGKLEDIFEQVSGKPLSYNNLLDVDAAMGLMAEYYAPTFAIIKHTNPCGVASRSSIEQAWHDALAGDPVSAFGGILIANREITGELAEQISELFFEVLIAPGFDEDSLGVLTRKKNRILLRTKSFITPEVRYRSVLNGVLWQTQDHKNSLPDQWQMATVRHPSEEEERDLVFANTVVKHLKSNAIALVKDTMLLGSGMGQTSRIDALKQAIEKAQSQGHDLRGAVMASDAFFPFPDSVEIAHRHGIRAVVQPGGSVKDKASVDFCNESGMAMAFTGNRHFKH